MPLPTFADLTPPTPDGMFEADLDQIADSWAAWWGLPAEMIVLSNTGLQALPILPDGNGDGTGRVPGLLANLWHVGHPAFFLDAAAKQRIRYPDGQLESAEAWTARIHLECVYRDLLDPDTGEWTNVLALVGLDPDRPADRDLIETYALGGYVEQLCDVEFGPPDGSIPTLTVEVTRAAFPPGQARFDTDAEDDEDEWATTNALSTFQTLHRQLDDALSPSPTQSLLLAQAFGRLHALASHGGDPADLHATVDMVASILARVVRAGGRAWDAIGNPPVDAKLPDGAMFDLDRLTRRVTVAGTTGGAATAVADLRDLAGAVAAWAAALDGHVQQWQAAQAQRRARRDAHAARVAGRTSRLSAGDLLRLHAITPVESVPLPVS